MANQNQGGQSQSERSGSQGGGQQSGQRGGQGFAGMSDDEQRRIAQKGGEAVSEDLVEDGIADPGGRVDAHEGSPVARLRYSIR